MEKLVLIDGNAIIHRAYHSMPKNLSSRGELTNAVYGFALTLIRVIEDLKPKYLVCSFDLAGPTFRHEKYEKYKATRVKADQELYDQIPRVRQLIEIMEIKIFEQSGFEADDLIGTVIKKVDKKAVSAYIVTGDKDAYQLLNHQVFIYDLKSRPGDPRIVNEETVIKKYALKPKDFVDLKALAGDSSDNIPGVPGIGDKTATELIKKFGNLDQIYQKIENGQTEEIKPRIVELLKKYKDQAYLSRELGQIHPDVKIDFNLEDCRFGDYDKDKLKDFFLDLNFRSLVTRFAKDRIEEKPATTVQKQDQQLKLL